MKSKTTPAKTARRTPASVPSQYIVGPYYDCVFFLLPLTAALCLGILISNSGFANQSFEFYDQDVTWSGLLIGIFIHAHLFVVFFRSHGNAAIRRLHPYRFLLVPVVLYAAIAPSLRYWPTRPARCVSLPAHLTGRTSPRTGPTVTARHNPGLTPTPVPVARAPRSVVHEPVDIHDNKHTRLYR